MKLFVRLKSRSVAWATVIAVAVCVVVQTALGADLAVLAVALLVSLVGLGSYRIAGSNNAAGWFALFFVVGNAIVALIAKTILLQPVDSNLYTPLQSFLALSAASAGLAVAVVVARILPVGSPLFHVVRSDRTLRWLSNSTFTMGAIAWYLNRRFQDPGGSGFGGLGVFWNLLLMAVIARTAMLLEQSGDRRSIDYTLVLMLCACTLMGLIDNSKTEAALPLVAYFAASLFFRRGFTLRQTGAGVLGLVLLVTVVSPMIHAFRAVGIQERPWRERLAVIEGGARVLVTGGGLSRYEKVASELFATGYYDYFGGGSGQMLLGRYASIQQIDPVIAAAGRNGVVGGRFFWPAFARLLPSFVYPQKPRYIESYGLVVHLGLIDPAGGKYPTVPLVAQSYAAYGLTGLLLIPFFTFVAFLLTLKKLGWRLHRNVYAIFFLCVFTVVYANQGDLGQYADAILRSFPLLGVILWLLTAMGRATWTKRAATPS